MKHLGCLLGTLIIMLILVGLPVMAAPWEIRGGETTITANQVVADDLFFSGDKLEIEGTVSGDLIVFAREVTVSGRVNGSILGIVTQRLTIAGAVGGNVRAAAGILEIKGQIGHNVSAYAMRFSTSRNSQVAGGVLGSYGELKLSGTVNGSVEVKAYSSNMIGGSIGGNVISKGTPLQWSPPVRIAGRVDDYSGLNAKTVANQKVRIGKGYHAHQNSTKQPFYYKYFFLISVIWFLGSLLMSLIFYRIFPRTAWRITQPTVAMLQQSFIIGLITLVAFPVAIVLLVISTVGLPIALVLLLLYFILIIFANVPVSLLLGRIVMRQYGPAYSARPSWLILTGSLIAGLIGALPVLGFILTTCAGMGMLVRNIRPEYKEVQPK
jgi:cytoskeletal protein CcmA (bactofilin family)